MKEYLKELKKCVNSALDDSINLIRDLFACKWWFMIVPALLFLPVLAFLLILSILALSWACISNLPIVQKAYKID